MKRSENQRFPSYSKNGSFFLNKSGMSQIITTVIMIGIVLVAIGAVWVVAQNILSEGLEDVSLGSLKVNLDIESVKVNRDLVEIKVKRNSGEANLVGINFILSDGENTEVFEEETDMKELATQTFSLDYDGVVKSVEIAPILANENGKEKVYDSVDKVDEKDSPELTLENQWWKQDASNVNILVIEEAESSGWVNKISSLGYNILINTAINSEEDLENYISSLDEGEKPDIIMCLRPAWSCAKASLFNSLYDSGYSIFTDGNDNTVNIYPILTDKYNNSQSGSIVPSGEKCAEPLSYNWTITSGSGGDSRRGILTIPDEACVIAKDSTWGFIEGIYLEEKGKGKWYHHQPNGAATDRLLDNVLKYLSR